MIFSICRNPIISNVLIRWAFIGFSLVEVSGFIGLVYSLLILYASSFNWINNYWIHLSIYIYINWSYNRSSFILFINLYINICYYWIHLSIYIIGSFFNDLIHLYINESIIFYLPLYMDPSIYIIGSIIHY